MALPRTIVTEPAPSRYKEAALKVWDFAKTHAHPISNAVSFGIGTGVNALGTAMKFINPQYEAPLYTLATFINPSIGRTLQAKLHPEGEVSICESSVKNNLLHGVNTGLSSFAFSYTSAPVVLALGPGWPALIAISAVQAVAAPKAAHLLDKAEQVIGQKVPPLLSATKQGLFSCKDRLAGWLHRKPQPIHQDRLEQGLPALGETRSLLR